MSTEIIAALCDRVKGIEVLPVEAEKATAAQTALIALLAPDADTGTPSFWYGNANESVVYPCITFRFSGGTPDLRFSDGTVSVDDILLDVDYWNNTGAIATIMEIDKQFRRLFDETKGAPELPLEGDLEAVSFTAFTGLITGYDANRNAWFGLRRYRVIIEEEE